MSQRKYLWAWFTVPSLALLLGSIILIGIFLFQAAANSSQTVIQEIQQQILQQINARLSRQLEAAMQLNQINHASFQNGILNLASPEERERYFTTHLDGYPEAAMSFIGLADGSFYGARRMASGEIQVVRNNSATGGVSMYYRTNESGEGTEFVEQFPGFDPRKRPWYTRAVEAGEPAFSGVYSHFVFREPTITASHPVYDDNNQLIGVLGVDYLLSWLGGMLSDMPIGEYGQVFIVDGAGMLVADSSGEPAYVVEDNASRLIPALESGNPLIPAALGLPEEVWAEEAQAIYQFSSEGQKYYTARGHFQQYGNNWQIYALLAEDDFLGAAKRATGQSIFILGIAALFSLIFTYWLGAHVIRLLARLEKEVAERNLELQGRNEELQRLSFSDSLTGIANRRLLDERIEMYWQMLMQFKRPLGVFMLDIDFFKNYNDTYGHQAGDDCLKDIAAMLREKVRRVTDLVARYGGEEFIIVLQEPDVEKLLDFAERIRAGVEELNIEHATSPFHRVTISVGCAWQVPEEGSAPAELIERADKALYTAKQAGRNTVICADCS